MKESYGEGVANHTKVNELVTRTPFVFVGNNNYRLFGLRVGKRKGLQDGILQVCSVANPSRLVLFRTLVAAIAGNRDAAPELNVSSAKEDISAHCATASPSPSAVRSSP